MASYMMLLYRSDAEAAEAAGRDGESALWDELNQRLQEAGLAAARPLLERALAIRERVLGPDHPDTALARANLAAVGPPTL